MQGGYHVSQTECAFIRAEGVTTVKWSARDLLCLPQVIVRSWVADCRATCCDPSVMSTGCDSQHAAP